MAKILCPYHNDNTPSMEVYEEYSHCYVCNAHVKNQELGVANATFSKKEPEKIEASMEYIQNLPTQRLRGLEFPCDDVSYYIVWPSRNYYKRRYFEGEQRYSGPKGIKPPLFIQQFPRQNTHLVVIEGEINALSILHSVGNSLFDVTICSPGAATNFSRFIKTMALYKKITLILDYDAPGVVYGTETKEKLLKMGKHCNLINVTSDYNEVLQRMGPEALVKQFKGDIGL